MSSPTDEEQVQGGRALLRGRVFGFPVHLDASFVVIMGLLGYRPGVTVTWIVLWLAITPVAVLSHELGHAFLARAAGARPAISLAGFGGVTTYTPPRPLSRGRSLGISLAGPAVGLVLGFGLLAINIGLGDSIVGGGWIATGLAIGEWTCIGWSLLNLLPILPLDGGQAIRELIPGNPAVRTRRAAMLSVVAAGLVAVGAYLVHQPFIALFMVFFGASNILALRQAPAGSGAGQEQPIAPEQAVVHFLWTGQPARAREVLGSFGPDTQVDLAVHGAVLALTGDPAQGHALLDQEVQRRPGDSNVAALLVLTQALEHDWDALIGTLQGPVGPNVPAAAVNRAIEEARGIGREDVAGRLTLLGNRPAG